MVRLTDYFIMTHTSKPRFSEGLTNKLTALGIYHVCTGYTWLAAIAKSYSKLKYSNLKHKKQSEGKMIHDRNILRQQISHSSRSAAANKTVFTNLMKESALV